MSLLATGRAIPGGRRRPVARLRRRAVQALMLLAAGAGTAGCAGSAPAVPPTAPSQSGPPPITIPLKVRWPAMAGAIPIVRVRVGHGREVPVILDTGSTGLHIYAPAVRLGRRSGVTLTDHADSATYFDGTVQRGVVGYAKIAVGGVTTTHRVPFGYVTTVACVRQLARCPGAGGIPSDVAHGIYGILGIGLTRSREGLENPLLGLREPYGREWSIALHRSRGTLTLGPRIAASPVAQFRLKRDRSGPRGARDWKDQEARVCWAAVSLRGSGCEPTVFDTGSFTMFWYGGLLSRATTYYGSILVSPGTYIAAWQPGRHLPFWSFTAGQDFSRNTVLALHGGHPLVIAAVQSFLTFRIVYDDTRGRILLYRPGPS